MIYLNLFHGRLDPKQDMDEIGFFGPVLGPFPYLHYTYGTINPISPMITIDNTEYDFPDWDEHGLIPFLGSYYGDLSIFPEGDMDDPVMKKLTETQKIFSTPKEDLVLYINHEFEWVKHYVYLSLEGKYKHTKLKKFEDQI